MDLTHVMQTCVRKRRLLLHQYSKSQLEIEIIGYEFLATENI